MNKAILIISFIFFLGAVALVLVNYYTNKQPELSDTECFIGGCSGELCTSDPEAMSTCEELPGAICLQKEGVSCELVAGKCQWVLSAQSAECFLDIEQQYGKEATETRIKHLFEKAREL